MNAYHQRTRSWTAESDSTLPVAEGTIQYAELVPDPSSGEELCRLRIDALPGIVVNYRIAPLSQVPAPGQRVAVGYRLSTFPPDEAWALWLRATTDEE